MIDQNVIQNLQELIGKINSVFVVLDVNSKPDQVAAGVSFYLALKNLGKDATLFSAEDLSKKYDFFGINEIKTELGKQNLVVSFDYSEEKVDKVSYHIGEESGKFYLTVKPKKGVAPLDSSSVEFSYSGAETDLIVLFGVHDFENLDQLYFGYESLYQDIPLVVVHHFDPNIGGWVVDTSGNVDAAETMVGLIESLGATITPEMATNLLNSIENSTKFFSSLSTTAETFETVAKLIRAGARRSKLNSDRRVDESQDVQPDSENDFLVNHEQSFASQKEGEISPQQPPKNTTVPAPKKNHKNSK